MWDEKRRQKQVERKRRKRDERRLRGASEGQQPDSSRLRKESVASGIVEMALSSPTSMKLPPGAEGWTIVRSYVPVRDIWVATGLGSGGIIRQQPDGRYASAFFSLELLNHGLQSMWGKADET